MLIHILKCDWCGSETIYDPHHYTVVEYSRLREHWTKIAVDRYGICDTCNNLFVQFIMSLAQKDDAE